MAAGSELLDLVKSLAADFQHLSTNQCDEAVEDLLQRCAEQGHDLPLDACKALVTFALSIVAVRCVGHRPLQWSCLDLVSRSARAARTFESKADAAELQSFFFKLCKKEVKSQPVWKPRVCVLMLQYALRWAQVTNLAKVLGAGDEAGGCKLELVTGFLEAMYGETMRSSHWKPRWKHKATLALRRFLIAVPPLQDHAVAFMSKKDDLPMLLVGAIAQTSAAKPDSPHRCKLLELYVKHALEAKQPASDASLEAWAPLLGLVSPEDVEKQLIPTALRMSKRNAASAAKSVPSMAAHLGSDLSKHAREILDPLAVDMIKDKDRRVSGILLIHHVVQKCGDSAAPITIAEAWTELLKKTSKADEKQAVLMALRSLSEALSPGLAEVGRATDPKGHLAKVAGEDTNEETRVLAYRTFGNFARCSPPAVQTVQELLKPLADKKAPARAVLAALESLSDVAAIAASQGAAVPWATAAIEKSLPWLVVAVTKAVQRHHSVLAWAICGALGVTDGDSLISKLKKEHLTVLKDGPSFLNAVPTILKASPAELLSQAQLWRAVLSGCLGGMPAVGAAAKTLLSEGTVLRLPPSPFTEALPLSRTAVVLLAALHGMCSGRGEASQPIQRGVPKVLPSERLGLLTACSAVSDVPPRDLHLVLAQVLASWLAELMALPESQRRLQNSALRSTLVDICSAVAHDSETPHPETVALLTVAAHHPLLSSIRWPTQRFWGWLRSKGPLAKPLRCAPAAAWHAIKQLLLAGRLLPDRDNSGFRLACLQLARSFDVGTAESADEREAMQGELAALVQQCTVALHSEDVEREDEANVPVFFGHEGRLWMEEGTYVAQEREDKNVKRNKFLKGLYDDDDMVAEKAVAAAQKPAAAKGKAKAGAKAGGKAKAKAGSAPSAGNMTASDIEAARIQEQSDIRARIRIYVDEANFAMGVLAAVAESLDNAEILEEAMAELVPHLARLLKSPLTVMQARRCARALASRVVSDVIVARRDLLPDALMVAERAWLQRDPRQAGTPGDTPVCELVLEGVEAKRPMPVGTMAMVLPVILRALSEPGPKLERVCDRSLVLIEQQLKAGAELPENLVGRLFESLNVALLALPGLRSKTQAALLAVAKYLVSTEDQLARLSGMFFAEDEQVRSVVISALAAVKENELVLDGKLDPSPLRAVLRLGTLDPDVEEVAKETSEELELEGDEALLLELIDFASKKSGLDEAVQNLIAKAVADVLTELEDAAMATTALDLLTQLFREDAASRITVARCLAQVFGSNLEGEEQVIKAFRFLLRQGLALTSGSTPEAAGLRDLLLASGISLIEGHGEEMANVLIETIEDFEDGVGAAAGESARLGVAVFLGALSKHLPGDHPKLPEVLPRLLQRLLDKESSTSVQDAIVKVMPPLIKQNKEQATETLEQLLETSLAPKTDGVTRRGSAMGLGATVKGLSIQAVSQHGILKRIEAAAEDKKEASVRMGALMCLEGLTLSLGRLFDPYVVSSLPLLLQAFSDPNRNVQAASKTAAKAMMSQLSGPGVKQVLKPLLEGIRDQQWRTKLGSIELLASMTSCLPKQLAACLPQVVPALCTVINDQHAKVKDAARIALEKIGSIITSPELRNIAPDLLHALTDGAQYEHITKNVLDKLLGTSFVHHIDAPSLSLVCPLVQRALKERTAEMKIKGAQIVGSMVLLIKDAKDIQPYLPLLLPQLKVTLVDPIPDVRATAAKAFGTLANGLPEEMLGDVLPWLFNMLRSSESAVERSGAAHGLSEVLMAMGVERIEMLLPDILANARNKEAAPEIKEGYLGLFVYLPVAMGGSFEPYIEEVLQVLLGGVADDTSSVRDTAFRAAQVLTKQFGSSHTARLLPAFEEGVFDVDWRLRHASVQLIGQLIEQILRAHRIPTHSAELMFCEVLPREWRCHVLACLYIVRSDENGVVKQACAQVWKALVQNTPRTLKELLPSLMTRLIANLAASNREKQRVAARCVGDLVGKLGERVMPELMPIFMNTLTTGDACSREGVCIGLAELINATTKQLLMDYLGDLIPAIRQAIIDDVETVRNSASSVVALLHNQLGQRATVDVVSWLLTQLQEGDVEEHGDLFLNGLEKLMAKQPSTVLPIVLEQLTEPCEDGGFTRFQLQGLATLAVVPDAHTVHRHLSDVLPVMIGVAGDEEADDALIEAAVDAASKVMDRVEQGGVNLLFAELIGAVKDASSASRRSMACRLLERFFAESQLDVVSVLPLALPAVLPPALSDSDTEALASGVKALNSIVKRCKKEELAPYLSDVRAAIGQLIIDPETKREDPKKLLPGLCDHNGLEPLYPIYQHGLMFGTAEQRELAAKGLGELVNHTSEAALKPYVVKITGPLIRIVGDRFPGTVKKAIVDTLKSLLLRGGATLKPFLPQLQTTYVKCLADPSEAVRLKAAESLGTLVRLSTRTEPLIKELAGGVATHADPAVRHAMCTALGEVLLNVPQATTEAALSNILEAILPRALGGMEGQQEREVAAWVLGVVMRRHAPPEQAMNLLDDDILMALDAEEPPIRHAGAYALAGACWCQNPLLPAPAENLLERLKDLALEWLPKLLADKDAEVLAAATVLVAATARLHAAAALPFSGLADFADRFASLVVPGPVPARTVLLASYHFASAAAEVDEPVPSGGRLAVAVAMRAVDKECDIPEAAEKAMAAILCRKAASEGEVKAALGKLVSSLEGKPAQALNDYVLKRLKTIAQQSGSHEIAWDFF